MHALHTFCFAVCLALGMMLTATPGAAQSSGHQPDSVQEVSWDETAQPPLSYINKTPVELSTREREALALAARWEAESPTPFQAGGKLVFLHGVSTPTIVTAPLHVTDVELQPGETLHDVVVGDSARWLMDVAKAGVGDAETAHLLIKPVDAGLATSAVVTTSRRVYHLRLVSQREEDGGHMPYVGFAYRDDHIRRFREREATTAKESRWRTTAQGADLSALHFNYAITGDAPWKPAQVYDDGRQTFIRLPASAATGAAAEIPVLLARQGDADVLVNYRVQGDAIVMDGVFPRVLLVAGVGGAQRTVEIIREDG